MGATAGPPLICWRAPQFCCCAPLHMYQTKLGLDYHYKIYYIYCCAPDFCCYAPLYTLSSTLCYAVSGSPIHISLTCSTCFNLTL
jgi:hypothetical protein